MLRRHAYSDSKTNSTNNTKVIKYTELIPCYCLTVKLYMQ